MESGAAGESSAKMVFDIDEEKKNEALAVAKAAVENNSEEKKISAEIKRHFDQKYGPTWHCIAGSDFKAFVTHESKSFIFFYVGKQAILLYKAG